MHSNHAPYCTVYTYGLTVQPIPLCTLQTKSCTALCSNIYIQSNTREAHYIGSIYVQVNRMLSLEETQCSESLNLQPYLLPLLLSPSSPPPSIF